MSVAVIIALSVSAGVILGAGVAAVAVGAVVGAAIRDNEGNEGRKW